MDASLLPHTRVHPLRLNVPEGVQCYVKRDDATGYAAAAGKLRKYASLVPWLEAQAYAQVAIIGGENSNNLVGLAQVLLERGIQPVPFVLPAHTPGHNAFLLELLVPRSQWQIVPRRDWASAEERAQEWVAEQAAQGIPAGVVPEGAWHPAALPGACELMTDIARNESELGLRFDHVLMEAGTGLSAMALCIAFARAGRATPVHILLLADMPGQFAMDLWHPLTWANNAWGLTLARNDLHHRLYQLPHAKAFGSVNARLLASIVRFARTQGILTDPIYSGKLFMEAEDIITREQLQGNVLVVHSGGSALPGFQAKFQGLL